MENSEKDKLIDKIPVEMKRYLSVNIMLSHTAKVEDEYITFTKYEHLPESYYNKSFCCRNLRKEDYYKPICTKLIIE